MSDIIRVTLPEKVQPWYELGVGVPPRDNWQYGHSITYMIHPIIDLTNFPSLGMSKLVCLLLSFSAY